GDWTMLLSWLRSPRTSHERPARFRPMLESLESRLVPTAPHFIGSATSSVNSAGALVVSWKEAGLGDNVTVKYELDAQGTATYACINGGGNHPQAANKETVSAPVSSTGMFTSGKNGNITASLSAGPVSAGDFHCPPGQTMVLASVSYTGITLMD